MSYATDVVTLANDDNIAPGMTYTFTLKLGNYFSMPSESTILNDLIQTAPSFIGSPQVHEASGAGLFTNYYNITFTYTGDGSDVVSDIGAELVQAISQASNDDMSFVQATGGTAGLNAITQATNAASTVATAVGSTVGTAVGAAASTAVQAATDATTKNLGFSGWLVIGLAVIALLAYFSSSTGIRVRQ